MDNFQLVLYFKKRVFVGGKPTLKSMIDNRKKVTANLSPKEYDDIMDEHAKIDGEDGTEETVDAWVLFYEDKHFLENVRQFEKDAQFIEWEDSAKEIIKQQLRNL